MTMHDPCTRAKIDFYQQRDESLAKAVSTWHSIFQPPWPNPMDWEETRWFSEREHSVELFCAWNPTSATTVPHGTKASAASCLFLFLREIQTRKLGKGGAKRNVRHTTWETLQIAMARVHVAACVHPPGTTSSSKPQISLKRSGAEQAVAK